MGTHIRGFRKRWRIRRIYTLDEGSHRPALGELIKRLRDRGVAVANIAELRQPFDPEWPRVKEWIDEIRPHLNRAIDAMWANFDPAAIVFGSELSRRLGELLVAVPPPEKYWRTGLAAVEPKRILSSVEGNPAVMGVALMPLKEMYFV
jgi:predicted NBD/HSP70 family sugar kinase